MDDGSATVAVVTRAPKRSASSLSTHRHSTNDNGNRTSLIKTKIQRIDGQYKASATCSVSNNQSESTTSIDDYDEPVILGTFPPRIENSSRYRTRTDIYDDETGDDQHSSSTSPDCSPVCEPIPLTTVQELTGQSPIKSTVTTTRKSVRLLSSSSESISVHDVAAEPILAPTSPTLSRRRSTRLVGDDVQQPSVIVNESDAPTPAVQQRLKVLKKSKDTTSVNKTSVPSGRSAIPMEENQAIVDTSILSLSPAATINEPYIVEEDITMKSISTDASSKPSQSMNDQSKMKVRLKTTTVVPHASQTKKITNNVPNKSTTTPVKANKVNPSTTVMPKPKKPLTIPKETVIANQKPTPTKTAPVVTPKKPLPNVTVKPSLSNSEKPNRLPSTSAKPVDKKPSDIKSATVPSPPKPIPVTTLGKIPKLNPANKQSKQVEPTPSTSLTDQKLDLLATGKESIGTEKYPLARQRSPQAQPQRHHPVLDDHDPFPPLSPHAHNDDIDNIIGRQLPKPLVQQQKHPRYPSLMDTIPRPVGQSNSNFSRTNSMGLENSESQSPLSPPPSSTLYPIPSPPSRSTLVDARNNQSTLHPALLNFDQPPQFNKKPIVNNLFSTPTVLPSSSSSSANFLNAQPVPLVPLISHNSSQESRVSTTTTTSNLWDSASSDDEADDSNALRFYRQNMRAVEEELLKANEPRSATPPPPVDSRTEHLLRRQKIASLGLIGANGSGSYEDNTNNSVNNNAVKPSESADDFECVAMDLDSPKHRTQSESSDNNHSTVEMDNNRKSNTNGTADSKVSEALSGGTKKSGTKGGSLLSNRPLKTTSMTLIDELKNAVNPSVSSKQTVLSPRSHSSSRSRSHTRSRTRSRSRSRSRSSLTSISSSSSSSRKRHSRSRQRSSKRRSSKHRTRRRSPSSEEVERDFSGNNNKYQPPPPIHYHHQHHHQPPWPPARQPSGLLPVPPLLPPPYYPPSTRPLMHHQPPMESSAASGNGRFNYRHSHHQRHHPPQPPPLLHPPFYPLGPPQPLMQSTSRNHHHPMPRFPPAPRFDMPPAVPGPLSGPPPSFNQFKYESEERLAMKRAKREAVAAAINSSSRRPPPSTGDRKKGPNIPKSTGNSDPQDMDLLVMEREKLLAELNEMSDDGDVDNNGTSLTSKRSLSTTKSHKPIEDDEGEEGELSESD